MTRAEYAPRVAVHPDRTGARKSGLNRVAVLHTSEGREGGTAATALCGFMTQPGDRSNGAGGRYGSSYAAVFDLHRLVWPCVPYDVVSYSASGANHDGVHGCFPGTARQTRDEWLDAVSRDYIRTAAAWLVDVRDELGIPLVRLTARQVKAGATGYCDHFAITQAYGLTDHTDVGVAFPWDVLAADIEALMAPPLTPDEEDDDMWVFKWEGEPYQAVGWLDPDQDVFKWRGAPDGDRLVAAGIAKRASCDLSQAQKAHPFFHRVDG